MEDLSFFIRCLGLLTACVGGIWLLVIVFNENPGWGVVCLFVPLAILVFALTHWDISKSLDDIFEEIYAAQMNRTGCSG